jgi:long-chain acyl-CoA synthetase
VTGAQLGPGGTAADGPVVREPVPPLPNLVALVAQSVTRRPDAVAMRWWDPATHRWRSMTYRELWRRVRETSIGLSRQGVGRGDRVLIFSRSRPEWGIADLATLALGAVTCPIFASEGPGRIREISRRIRARVAFVESTTEAAALRDAASAGAPGMIVSFEPSSSDGDGGLMSLAGLHGDVTADAAAAWEAGWRSIGPDDDASIVHTIGRGGELVGAVLTHRNILRNYEMVVPALRLTHREVVLSVLPLSHMLERGTGLYVPLGLGATVVYSPPKRRQWTNVLREVRPTAMVAVPLLVDRLADAVRAELRRRPAWQRALVHRTMRAEWRRHRTGSLKDRALARVGRGLVTGPVRANLGGRLRFIACGGSRLAPRTGRFLTVLGIPVVEGYGLTETAPLVTLNDLASPRFGTVGRPLSGTAVRIDPVHGEVLVRGTQVMRGYLDDPATTSRAIDAGGWLHTGDIGHFDPEGHLVISGQLKPIVVLATGKKVARRAVEAALRTSPLIADAMVLGSGEPELRAVIIPDVAGLPAGIDGDAGALRSVIEREIQDRLAGFARYERPRVIDIQAPMNPRRASPPSRDPPAAKDASSVRGSAT